MKILAIHFKNINSLEGENSIDFTQPPIADTGVFAITGANGSGKSSILDAITLGLYGETFRFHRPAAFVMTKHTADCFAKVQFALDGGSYQASWQAQRDPADPEGDLEAPQMQLLNLGDGAVLASGQAQVCAKVAELTGMDFRNFTRSIMLAQGDFAAFLHALDSERMAILEKIVGADIYAEYRQEILARSERAQQDLAALSQQLAECQLLEPEQLAARQLDLADFSERHQELAARQAALRQQQSATEAASELRQQLAVAETQVQQAERELAGVEAKLAQIAKTEAVSAFQQDLQSLAEHEQAVATSQAAMVELAGELETLKQHLAGRPEPANLAEKSLPQQQAAIAELSGKLNVARSNQQSEMALSHSLLRQAAEKQALIDKLSGWLEEHAADASLLENFPETGKLKKLRAELTSLSAQHKKFAKEDSKASEKSKNRQAMLEQAIKKQQELERQLAAEQAELEALVRGRSWEQLVDLRAEQQERTQAFQQLHDTAVAYQELAQTKFSWFGLAASRSRPGDDVERLTQDLETITEQIKREENIQKTLEQARQFEALARKMAGDRKHLVDGKPCPLCGALQHPYSKRPPVFADPLKAAADQQLKIRNLQAVAQQLKKRIDDSHKTSARSQRLAQRRQQLHSQWLSLCNRMNVAVGLEIKDLPAMAALFAIENRQLKEISTLLELYQEKQLRISTKQSQLAENAHLVETLKQQAERLGASASSQIQEHQQVATALAALRQEEQALAAKIAAQLSALGEKMPERGKEDSLFDKLNERRQDYHGYAFRKNSLTEEVQNLNDKRAECEQEISRYQELLELYNEQLEGAETVGLYLAITEKQKLLAEQEQRLVHLQDQLLVTQSIMQKQLADSPFQSLDQVRTLLVLHAQKDSLAAEQDRCQKVLAERQANLAALASALEQHRRQYPELLPVAELNQQLKSLAEQLDIAELECRRLQKILDEQATTAKRHAEIDQKLRQQQASADACAAEVRLLAADQGMALRRKAQERLAEQLLAQTNVLLEKLSGRYYLRQQPDSQGLALEVEDTYQGNVRRLPKTLSGGETFVVSLALALGLSELANNGRAVDSLFLDEGFGNLDAETLYTVVATLENLKAHGKTIGVISHVEAVQKRFKAQLQVVKKANGLGVLRPAS